MKNSEMEDHGEVIEHPRWRISLAWLFPLIAALAAGGLFYSNWKSQGPEIQIEFATAPGVQPGKTPFIYRGVEAGIVSKVHLDETMGKAIVFVRLKAFASALACQGTVFWIDQPVIGIGSVSGIESLIQGNSLKARMGNGAPTNKFIGSEVAPLSQLEEPSVNITLRAENVPFLDRGSPVYYRGIVIGGVRGKILNIGEAPMLSVMIHNEFAHLVRKNSYFWVLPAASVKLGAGMLQIDLAGAKALLLGGISMDTFDESGELAGDNAEFPLAATETCARANGAKIEVAFDNGFGLRPHITDVRYLGMPIGIVQNINADMELQKIYATIQLYPAYEKFHQEGATFTLVQPKISLQGISGLETLLAGIYIDATPGTGPQQVEPFLGKTGFGNEDAPLNGIKVTLRAKEIPSIGAGAPVFLRGVQVGKVVSKSLDALHRPLLTLTIDKEFEKSLTKNVKFWRFPATSAKAGPGVLNVDIAGIEALWQGGVAFDCFGEPGGPIDDNDVFNLFANERVARADSPPIRIEFVNGQGLLAGETQLRYRGVPVGIVETVTSLEDKVVVTARFEAGKDFLRRKGTLFSVVRPSISLKEVSGLEALVSGVYIECQPSTKGTSLTTRFQGVTAQYAQAESIVASGFEINLRSMSTTLGADSPVRYRGVLVGKIARKVLSADGKTAELVASIESQYAPLVRENSKFWDASGMQLTLGFLGLKVQSNSLKALGLAGIEFATPEDNAMGAKVKQGHVFELYEAPRKEWLRWAPSIPQK